MIKDKKPVIAFDLHGVVFRPDYKEIARIIFAAPQKYKLFLSLLDPRFIIMMGSLIKKIAVPEEYIMKLSCAVPYLKKYVQPGIALANAQKPQIETVKLIHQLKDQNIDLFVFSNIGERTYEQLVKKFPDIMGLFKGALVTSAQDNYIKKPHPQIFKKFAEQCHQDLNNLIFIDNKHKNIHAALQYGIDGIYFKNPHQLKEELIRRNLISTAL